MFISSNLGVEGLVDGVLRLGLHLSPGLAVDVVRVELGHIGRQVAPVKYGWIASVSSGIYQLSLKKDRIITCFLPGEDGGGGPGLVAVGLDAHGVRGQAGVVDLDLRGKILHMIRVTSAIMTCTK